MIEKINNMIDRFIKVTDVNRKEICICLSLEDYIKLISEKAIIEEMERFFEQNISINLNLILSLFFQVKKIRIDKRSYVTLSLI